jgi:hypothetical protein
MAREDVRTRLRAVLWLSVDERKRGRPPAIILGARIASARSVKAA